jgi:flavin-dependent dehydrogenase
MRARGRGGVPETCEATLVVAADGRRSSLVRQLHPELGDPARAERDAWFGLKAHLAVAAAPLGRRVELHLFDGGYAGLAPVEQARVNLCMLVRLHALRAAGGSPGRLFLERVLVNPAIREAIGDGEVATPWVSCGPLRFGTRLPAAAGALFVGDAAGTVDPFCGEGMSNALAGAELALPFALEAVARGGLTPDLAQGYARAWRRAFAPVTHRVRVLGGLFGHPRLATALLALLRGAGKTFTPRLVAATRTGWSA